MGVKKFGGFLHVAEQVTISAVTSVWLPVQGTREPAVVAEHIQASLCFLVIKLYFAVTNNCVHY